MPKSECVKNLTCLVCDRQLKFSPLSVFDTLDFPSFLLARPKEILSSFLSNRKQCFIHGFRLSPPFSSSHARLCHFFFLPSTPPLTTRRSPKSSGPDFWEKSRQKIFSLSLKTSFSSKKKKQKYLQPRVNKSIDILLEAAIIAKLKTRKIRNYWKSWKF